MYCPRDTWSSILFSLPDDLALYVPVPAHGTIHIDKASYTVNYTCELPYVLETEEAFILMEFDCSAQNLSQFVPNDLPGCIDRKSPAHRRNSTECSFCIEAIIKCQYVLLLLACWQTARTNVDHLLDQDVTVCAVSDVRLTYVAIPLSRLGLYTPDPTTLYSLEVTGGQDMICATKRGVEVMVPEGDITDTSSQCDIMFRSCALVSYAEITGTTHCVFDCPNWPAANTDYVYVRFHSQHSAPCEVNLLS